MAAPSSSSSSQASQPSERRNASSSAGMTSFAAFLPALGPAWSALLLLLPFPFMAGTQAPPLLLLWLAASRAAPLASAGAGACGVPGCHGGACASGCGCSSAGLLLPAAWLAAAAAAALGDWGADRALPLGTGAASSQASGREATGLSLRRSDSKKLLRSFSRAAPAPDLA